MEKKLIRFDDTVCDYCNRIQISMKKKEVWCPELGRELEYRCDMSKICDEEEHQTLKYNLENPRFNLELEEVLDCPMIVRCVGSFMKDNLIKKNAGK